MDTWPVHVAHTGAQGTLGVSSDGRVTFSGAALAPAGHVLADAHVAPDAPATLVLCLAAAPAQWTCDVCGAQAAGARCAECGNAPDFSLPQWQQRAETSAAALWTCDVCGLERNPGRTCMACGADRPAGGAAGSPGRATWACATCTLENGLGDGRCAACGSPAAFVAEGNGVRSALVFATPDAAAYACERILTAANKRKSSAGRGLGGIFERSRAEAAAVADDIAAAFSDLDALCSRADALLRLARDALGRAEASAETDLKRMLLELDCAAGGLSPTGLSAFLERLFSYRAGRGELPAVAVPDLYVLYARSAGGTPPAPGAFAGALSSLDPLRWRRLSLSARFEVVVWADVDLAGMLDVSPTRPTDAARVARAAACPMALASALLSHEEDRGALVRDVSPVTGVVAYYPNLILGATL